VPRIAPFRSALGLSIESSYGIVQIGNSAGITGVGEISMIWNGDGAALCPVVNDLIAPALMGLDALDINRAHQLMDAAVQFSRAANPAKAAVDMALYDIAGKTMGTPVYNLLGGRVRDTVPLSMSIRIAPIEEMIAQAKDSDVISPATANTSCNLSVFASSSSRGTSASSTCCRCHLSSIDRVASSPLPTERHSVLAPMRSTPRRELIHFQFPALRPVHP
jgi:hypothetical protein